MTETEKLKPCPMCEGAAWMRRAESGLFFATCKRCGVRTLQMHYELLVQQTGRDLNDGLGHDPRTSPAKANRSREG